MDKDSVEYINKAMRVMKDALCEISDGSPYPEQNTAVVKYFQRVAIRALEKVEILKKELTQ